MNISTSKMLLFIQWLIISVVLGWGRKIPNTFIEEFESYRLRV